MLKSFPRPFVDSAQSPGLQLPRGLLKKHQEHSQPSLYKKHLQSNQEYDGRHQAVDIVDKTQSPTEYSPTSGLFAFPFEI